MRAFMLIALASLQLSCASDGAVVEERVTDDDGVITECGEGPGLSPCRDASGLTYEEELDPDYVGNKTNKELLESSEKIKSEDPKELEKTIEAMEKY